MPPEHIEDVFNELDQRAPAALEPVMDYVYHTWIDSRTFQIHHWSVFMCATRTNNDVEGWHNRLNSHVSTRGPVPFYYLVSELYREASDIPLQLQLITEGKLERYQRERTRQLQAKIFQYWDQYTNREISASNLLERCAAIYGPATH